MQPGQLTPADFSAYPPKARAIAEQHLALFRTLPLSFLPLLLRELINYDWKFPAEREELDHQLAFLHEQPAERQAELMAPFRKLQLSEQLASVDWVNVPAQFSEQLSAYLWSTRQIDAFRQASVDYVARVNLAQAASKPPVMRLGMVIAGKDSSSSHRPLFRQLRSHGTRFTAVDPSNGVEDLIAVLQKRSAANPAPYAHWYIEGGPLESGHKGLTCVSYSELRPVCSKLLAKMTQLMQPGGGGPELLRSELQRMRPEELGFAASADPVLNRFQLSLLTEGSGTQIFSTTFVQWAAREALRRAQPWTLLARYAPRQRSSIIGVSNSQPLDPDGSLVDAEMGAYYTWINQGRLANPQGAGFLVWYEGHNEAIAIGPGVAAGKEDARPIKLGAIVASLG
jgi:hypothetical protein